MRTICTLLCISTLYHGQPLLPKKHLIIRGVGKEFLFLICLIFIFSPSLSYSLVFPIPFWVEYLFLVSHPMLVNVEKLLTVSNHTNDLLLIAEFLSLYNFVFSLKIHQHSVMFERNWERYSTCSLDNVFSFIFQNIL